MLISMSSERAYLARKVLCHLSLAPNRFAAAPLDSSVIPLLLLGFTQRPLRAPHFGGVAVVTRMTRNSMCKFDH